MASIRLQLAAGALALAVCAPAWAMCSVQADAVPAEAATAALVDGMAGAPSIPVTTDLALAGAPDASLALDKVLERRRLDNCIVDEFAGYKPRTEFDNTPYRFHMDAGKNFTAAEFEAWMKKRGVRIAKGKAATPAESAQPIAVPAAATAPAATVAPVSAAAGGSPPN